jgi:hypothetical protein
MRVEQVLGPVCRRIGCTQRRDSSRKLLLAIAIAIALGLLLPAAATAQLPSHPIITEAFLNPAGNDGPIGVAPNDHQEFIEIYLPPASALEASLSADNLNLTLYDVEGDFASLGRGHVNWRIDLPTFDLNPNNGTTPGAVARPSSGLVVLGWLDYLKPALVGGPPPDLAGTPSTRVPLVNLESPVVGFAFIGINGNQFGGTTNFPTPVAISFLDLVTHPYTGLFENGSGAMLLMDRDHPSYVELCSIEDPAICNTDADLANARLPMAPLLDAFAANDHVLFDPDLQPYLAPTGDSIDLESALQLGGLYSTVTPQVPERGEGYSREFLDVQKTTEDAIALNENPARDSERYQGVDVNGPFVPTPGKAVSTTDPASLSVRVESPDILKVLTDTTVRPSPESANIGGDFGMSFTTTAFEMFDAPNISVRGTTSECDPKGQVLVYPEFEVSVSPIAVPGETAVVATLVDATVAEVGDPPLTNDIAFGTITVRAVNPTTGKDAEGNPFQATSLIAIVGIADDPLVANEFAASELGQYIAARAGIDVADSDGKLDILLNPATDLSNPAVVAPLISALPTAPAAYIGEAGPIGKESLAQTVATSAQVVSGSTAYSDSFNGGNLIKARRFTNSSVLGSARTSGDPSYSPNGRVNYFSSGGGLTRGNGYWNATTNRDFEIAILETNLEGAVLETGSKDDFGIILKVESVFAGSPVVPGEFVFLSMMGGREGTDIDTLRVPPDDPTLMNVVLIDLDPLDTVLRVASISDVYLVDANGESEVDPLEVFYLSVPEPGANLTLVTGAVSLAFLARSRKRVGARMSTHPAQKTEEGRTMSRHPRVVKKPGFKVVE